jgi:hypothetical protein
MKLYALIYATLCRLFWNRRRKQWRLQWEVRNFVPYPNDYVELMPSIEEFAKLYLAQDHDAFRKEYMCRWTDIQEPRHDYSQERLMGGKTYIKQRLNHRVCRQCGAEIFDHGPLCDTCADDIAAKEDR